MSEIDIFQYLEAHGIRYERFEHVPVFTCEEAELHLKHVPGKGTKNLFLRDKKGKMHALVSVTEEKQVDLKKLEPILNMEKVGFASPERLKKFLGVEPGSVTLLGLVYDKNKEVKVFIDRDLWECSELQCHPLRNTATVVIPRADLEKFFEATGHKIEIIEIPQK